jgi:hypothetical protein
MRFLSPPKTEAPASLAAAGAVGRSYGNVKWRCDSTSPDRGQQPLG